MAYVQCLSISLVFKFSSYNRIIFDYAYAPKNHDFPILWLENISWHCYLKVVSECTEFYFVRKTMFRVLMFGKYSFVMKFQSSYFMVILPSTR